MVSRDLARRIEELWARAQREYNGVFDQVMHRLSSEGFSQHKWELLREAGRNGDYSSPVVQEWVQIAEGYYPNVPWRRILGLDESEEDEVG